MKPKFKIGDIVKISDINNDIISSVVNIRIDKNNKITYFLDSCACWYDEWRLQLYNGEEITELQCNKIKYHVVKEHMYYKNTDGIDMINSTHFYGDINLNDVNTYFENKSDADKYMVECINDTYNGILSDNTKILTENKYANDDIFRMTYQYNTDDKHIIYGIKIYIDEINNK